MHIFRKITIADFGRSRLLFTATDKSAIRIVELARKRLIGDLAVTGIVTFIIIYSISNFL